MEPVPPDALCPYCKKPGCDVAERCSDIRTVIARLKGNRPDPAALPDSFSYCHAACRERGRAEFAAYCEEMHARPYREAKCPACLHRAVGWFEGEEDFPTPYAVVGRPSGWGRWDFEGGRKFVVCGHCGHRWEWHAPPP